jgi:hypothetical protein
VRAVRIPGWIAYLWGTALFALAVAEIVYASIFLSTLSGMFTSHISPLGVWAMSDAGYVVGLISAAIMAPLSMAFLALTLVDLVKWSGMPPRSRGPWVIAIVVLLHVGMLAYWSWWVAPWPGLGGTTMGASRLRASTS